MYDDEPDDKINRGDVDDEVDDRLFIDVMHLKIPVFQSLFELDDDEKVIDVQLL